FGSSVRRPMAVERPRCSETHGKLHSSDSEESILRIVSRGSRLVKTVAQGARAITTSIVESGVLSVRTAGWRRPGGGRGSRAGPSHGCNEAQQRGGGESCCQDKPPRAIGVHGVYKTPEGQW